MIYVFAECALDTCLYTLHRAVQRLRLRPKVYQVLTYLLLHRDRVVSKQELCEQIWSARAISDAAIENTMQAIRRVTGDDGRTQRIIQTFYGHGYRFVAPVTISSGAGTDTVAHNDTTSLPPAIRSQRLRQHQTAFSQATYPLPIAPAITQLSGSHGMGHHT